MTIYEKNLLILKNSRQDLYNGMKLIGDKGLSDNHQYSHIYVGEALDEDKFLVYVNGDEIIPFASTYSPKHEAERYALQFKEAWDEVNLLLIGFGNIEVARRILSDECPIDKCIVYEPSIDVFRRVMEEYDIEDILLNPKVMLLVESVNGDELEKILDRSINYRNWRNFYCSTFLYCEKLFCDQVKEARKIYGRVIGNKRSELQTLGHFAKAGLKNEIEAFYWMIDSKTIDSMVGMFPKDIPCIVVAAGPSLEKNVEVLRQAKGRAFIICVDTALNYLLERGISPDMACTADPQKGTRYFTRKEIENIPLAISTDSDYRALEKIGNVKPVYYSTTNDFAQRLYADKGLSVEYFDGGGSVGTVCFQIGVRLGFKTIILIGQDLAFTDRKAHAGMGKAVEKDLAYNMLMVDGYYGDKVLTRADFKYYIDWYNLRIPQLKDVHVINATEGGAKLKGAEQMSLQEVVNQYCIAECDVATLIKQIPEVWKGLEEKREFYYEIRKKYDFFLKVHKQLIQGIEGTKRAIYILQRGNCDVRELKKIDKMLEGITHMVSSDEGILILVKRMIEVDTSLNDDLLEVEDNLNLESVRLYGKMQTYIQNLLLALNELLPIWKGVMQKINIKYQFEPEN